MEEKGYLTYISMKRILKIRKLYFTLIINKNTELKRTRSIGESHTWQIEDI